MRNWGVVVALLVGARAADADDAIASRVEPPSQHLVYVEALGKGGLYGVGYEYAFAPRLAVGTAVSFAVIRDQQVFTVAPYLHVSLLQGKRHALFGELGAVLAHSRLPSPVEGWDGMSDTGGGGFASLGWELATRHFVVRTSGSVVAGEGGIGPMIGIAIGARP